MERTASLIIITIILAFCYVGESRYCHPVLCPPSKCFCPTTEPIFPDLNQIPQLVMLSFDDGVNSINYQTYRNVFTRKNLETQCPIKSTYFVTHEYTDYHLVHDLWRRGNEIAVHSITHNRDLKVWLNAEVDFWRAEMGGMKKLISHFADIPEAEIQGIRIPFLQSAGDTTWKAMKEDGFLYDSSVPVRNFVNPPLYPYTLDMGLVDDCQIEPCPNDRYPGLWEVPMVQWKMHDVNRDEDGKPLEVICAMVDACVPNPNTTDWTLRYLMENFNRHYLSNRAPLPIFMHEFWLLNPMRKAGFFQFLDALLKMPDVFFVTVNDAIEFLKSPVPVNEYKRKMNETCVREPKYTSCSQKYGATNCEYNGLKMFKGWPRYMKVCGNDCPRNYPWLNNPLGN